MRFLCLWQQQPRFVWGGGELQEHQERKAASAVGGEAVPCGHLPRELSGSIYLASSSAAVKMAEFCVRTHCRLLVPDAMHCVRIQRVLLKRDVSDKTA